VADVQPFCGLRYNVELIKDVTAVISPPYDIISAEEQKAYHQQSPHNVIRLEFGEEFPTDSFGDNKYTRATETLQIWLKEGILVKEPVPAFYIFQHRFARESGIKERWGLTAKVRLGRQGSTGARPHESVMEERIVDRLKLLRTSRASFSPIMAIIDHSRDNFAKLLMETAKAGPDVTAMDHEGVTHNMWVIRDERSIAKITAWCEKKTIYIADGHHRYETAAAYERECKALDPYWSGTEPFNFVMMNLIGGNDPGLIALPTHRLVKLPDSSLLVGLKEKLGRLFHVEEIAPVGATRPETLKAWGATLAKHGKRHAAIGVYGLIQDRLCLLHPRKESTLQNLMPRERSREWKSLDVTILHWLVIRQMLGIDTPKKESACLEYTRESAEALERVDSGTCQLAFLMNPIPVSRVLAVADAGERMPPKSTYFYPKLPTGLVMYPLWDQ
jgi:uncharacterized protein (DUF1015 family)